MASSNIPPIHHSSNEINNSADHLFNLIQLNPKLELNPYLFGNYDMVPLMSNSCDVNSPDPDNSAAVFLSDFQQFYGISNCMIVPKCSSDFHDSLAASDDSCYRQFQHVFEPGDGHHLYCTCTGFMVPNLHPTTSDSYDHMMGAEEKVEAKVNEETEVKVGRYSVEEKKDRILRYLKKKNQRNFNKTIKYACRKTLADKRIRVRGRFAKNCSSSEPSEEDEIVNKATDLIYNEEINSFYEYSGFQMKYDEEEWFETAMANIMHLPYT